VNHDYVTEGGAEAAEAVQQADASDEAAYLASLSKKVRRQSRPPRALPCPALPCPVYPYVRTRMSGSYAVITSCTLQ
jgi:hypothetical protein